MTMPRGTAASEIAALMTLRIAGSVHAMPPGESCVSSASNMLGMMIGVNCGSTKVDELLNTKTIVLWGPTSAISSPYSRWLKWPAKRAREDRLSRSAPDPDEPACRHAAASPGNA